jgi:MFS family permease
MKTLQKPYYGWWIVGELAITETITWGIVYYAFSVFIVPMETEFGWSREVITGAFSLALLVSGAIALPVGFWLDRNGARFLMTLAVACAALLIFAWSQVQTVFLFYAVWLCIGMCMAAVLYEPAFAVIAQWFQRRRGFALAVVTFAAGFASTIFLPLANWLLQCSNWREAVMTLAILLAITVIPLHAFILRRHPRDLGLQPDGDKPAVGAEKIKLPGSVSLRDALRQGSFWWFTAAYTFATMASAAVRFHLILLLLDRGFDSTFAATATGTIGAMQVLGRVLFAPTESKIPKQWMLTGIFIIQTLALMLLIFLPNTAGIWLFIILLGAANGALTLARPALLADFYGTVAYARISSVMELAKTVAVTIAPLWAAWLYTAQGNYDTVLWILVALSIFAVIASGFVRKHEKAIV